MRPWMKLAVVGGLAGVALGVSFAAERPIARRNLPTTKSARTERLEFFSRGGGSDEATEALSDPVAEELAEEATATPKRFTRSKPQRMELSAEAEPTSPAVDADGTETGTDSAESSGIPSPFSPVSAATSDSSATKPVTRSARTKLKPTTQSVEFLPPPTSAEPVEAPIKRKLVARKSASGIQPASFEKSDGQSGVTTDREHSGASGVTSADYRRTSSDPDKVQPVRAEKLAATTAEETTSVGPESKPSRVSIVADRAAKPIVAPTGRTVRPAISSDRVAPIKGSATNGTPTVTAEWVKRGNIIVGQECACDLVVKNTGKVAAYEVVVDVFFPPTVRLTQADPEPEVVSDHLEWSLPELPAGQERMIHIKMIPSQRGDLATTANVRFTGTAASVFKVEEPLLKLAVDAPSEVIVGDPFVQTVTVSNPGTGVAQNVKIHVTMPDGLQPARGDRSQIEIGSLSPGESRSVRLSYTATAGGEQTLEIEATADSGLAQSAEASVRVISPALNIAIEGPGLRYAGREARYTLTVTNDGQAATNNVRVTHRLPKGFKFVKADKGGTFDANTGFVNWFVGHIEPAQSVQLKLLLQATDLGNFEHHVVASAEHGLTAKASVPTKVEGSASLVMEIQDLDDPVEVGQETAYEVRVSNTGTKAAHNVGLTFELPTGIELINVQAATQHLAKNGLILFNDLPELAPGKTALFRIHVKGGAEGNQRVRARLTSESIEQELITEELTKFYAE